MSFRQYSLCNGCKGNYTSKIRHVYSKQHQDWMKRLLNRYREKIDEGHKYLLHPEIQDEFWEKGKKFWCYFCESEIDKHVVGDSVTVCAQGLIEHVASKEHNDAAKRFWKQNKLDSKLMSKYVMKEDILKKFYQLTEDAKNRFIQERSSLYQQYIAQIRQCEIQRQEILSSNPEVESKCKTDTIQNTRNHIGGSNVPSDQIGFNGEKKILPLLAKKSIFSGAVPPWLLDEEDLNTTNSSLSASSSGIGQTSSAVIGPTELDLKKHLEAEKKRKLNPNRVGASFDHTATTSANWLPSFGRVWNFKRRKQSKYHYHKEVKKKVKKKEEMNSK